jgi:large repetitive protein
MNHILSALKLPVLVAAFILSTFKLNGQNIQITPWQYEFCTTQIVTYTNVSPNPNSYYEWYVEDYTTYNSSGQAIDIFWGGSNSINLTSSLYGAGARVKLYEYDIATNTLISGNFVPMVSSVGNPQIPVYYEYTGCGLLRVPIVFDPIGFWPNRWAMWYKNGVATGVQTSMYGSPLTDSAVYEYKFKLACGDTITTGPIPVTRPSLPTITAQGPLIICQGDTVIINANSQVSIHNWTKDGVAIPGTSGLTSLKATNAGSYRVQGKYNSGGGTTCYFLSDPLIVTVQPGAFITSPVNQACNGDSILLTCTAANSYVWKKNGNVIAGANAQTLWVKTSGQYEVTTTGLICNTSFIKTITFYANATVAVAPSAAQDLCSGSIEILAASGNNIAAYSWLRNGVALTGSNTASIALTKAGNYKCVVSNVIGCTKTSNTVSVNNVSATTLPVKTLVLKPAASGKDSYTTSAFGQFSTNFGNAPTLEVSNWYKYFRTAERGYMEFDLSSLPAGSPIVSANLKLWIDTINQLNANVNLPNSLLFKRNIQPWSETGISWNNAPDSSEFQYVSIPCSTITSKSYVNANVIDLVKHWSYLPTQNFGMLIQFHEYNHLSWTSIPSSDHANANYHPKLTIKYYYADIVPSANLNLCTGGSVNFTTNVGAYTYQWYKNNSPIGGATTSNYTATTAGVYHVVISVPGGCSVSSVQKTVTVNAPPVVDITGDGPFNFCSGSTLTLSVDSLPGHTFQWKRNNANIAGAIYSKLSVNQDGTYVVRVTNACGQITRDTVVCTKVSNPAPNIQANGPLTFCAGQSVTFSAAVFPGVVNQWRKNGVNIVGGTGATYTATQSGTYSVQQTANGCVKTSGNKVVNVNCREGEFLAENYSVEIFPHPISDGASIVVGGEADFSEVYFLLFDLSGKQIHQFKAEGITTWFNRGNLNAGLYLLKTIYGNQQIGINKLLIAD